MQSSGDPATVLLVDDEEMVITSVRAFLALETDYRIEGFTDPEQAAAFMRRQPFDVIVSDYLIADSGEGERFSEGKPNSIPS